MDNDVNDFLKKIAQIESSSGQNFGHKEIKSGLQKGQTAIGTFGLLPNTVDEVIARSKDPALAPLADMNAKEQKAYLEANPDMEHKVAEHLAEHVLEKQGGDQEKAAYSWLYGHNLSPKTIEQRDYKDEPYVQKFNKLSAAMGPSPASAVKSMPYVPKPGEPKPPLDIGGTPEGDKVQQYLESSPSQDTLSLINKQRDDMNKAISVASRSPFEDTTPEEHEMVHKQLGPMLTGLIQGGPSVVAQAGVKAATPVAVGAWNKIKGFMGKAPMTPEEFVLRQAKNPDVMEVLKDIRQYTPEAPPNPARIQGIDNAVESQAAQDANQAAINNAQNLDADTLSPTQLLKLKGK